MASGATEAGFKLRELFMNSTLHDLKIVPGQASHAPHVISIVFSALRAFGIEPDPENWEAEIVSFGRNPESVKEFVALHGERVIGVGIFEVRDGGLAFFRDLYVDPEFRGMGVGRALMEKRIQAARDLGCTHAQLETRTEFKAAIALFESTGWQRGPDLRGPGDAPIGPDRTYVRRL